MSNIHGAYLRLWTWMELEQTSPLCKEFRRDSHCGNAILSSLNNKGNIRFVGWAISQISRKFLGRIKIKINRVSSNLIYRYSFTLSLRLCQVDWRRWSIEILFEKQFASRQTTKLICKANISRRYAGQISVITLRNFVSSRRNFVESSDVSCGAMIYRLHYTKAIQEV